MRKFGKLFLLITLVCFGILVLASCGKEVKLSVNFIVDGETYATISTSGKEDLQMPKNPTKEDYTFDGWFWDKDVWQKPFTANSLFDAPLSSDMSVYAKFIHQHKETDWEIDSSFVDDTTTTYRCKICGETKSEPKAETHIHSYSDTWTIISEPTCTEKGSKKHVCECGEEETDEIAPIGHTWGDWIIISEAKCTEKGSQKHTCLTCGQEETAEIAEVGHNKRSDNNRIEPTCTETGITNSYSCSICGELLIPQNVLPSLGHDYHDVITAPTCTEQGYTTHTCSRCDDSYDDAYVVATGHTEIIDQAVVPTCTTPGLTEGKHCSVCGAIIVAQEVLNVLGHDYHEAVTAPTCTGQGYTTHTCSVCGDSYVDTYMDAIGHTEALDEAVAPTCTTTGLTEGRHCSVCGTTIIAQSVINALGHDYQVVVTPPTCTAQGYTTHTCTRCGESYVDSHIDATGHDIVHYDAKAATCTEIGWYAYETCSRCDYSTYEEIPALGHTEAIIEAVSPTCTETGLTEGKRCSVCGETLIEQQVVAILGHDIVHHSAKAPSCTEIGWYAYDTCSRCDYTTYEEIPALGHDYNAAVIPPTCTEQGYTTHTCSRCGDIYVDGYVDATGHTETIDAAVAATCTSTGLTEGKHCSVCGAIIIAQETIAALGHDYNSVVTPPTCTEQGYTTHTCSRCSDSYVDTPVDALGHNLVHHNAQAAICTQIGWNAYDICSRCDYTTYEEIPALGHDYNAVVTPPTCVEQGYTTHTCSRCGDSYVDTPVNALGHNLAHHNAQAATCTQIGWNAYDTCSRCDHTTYEEIPALGHDYHSVVIPATEEEEGYITYTCNRCGNTYGEYIDALKASGLQYELKSNEYSVSGYNGAGTEIVIPRKHLGKDVTGIKASAFSNKISITSITVLNSVTNIGAGAFAGCSSLENLTIPFVGNRSGVTGSDTYQYSLGYLFGTVSYTGSVATEQYYYGSSIEEATGSTYYVPLSLRSVTVAGGYIPYGAFYNCGMIEEVVCGDGVTSIAKEAFAHCSGLTSISVPFIGTSLSASGKETLFGAIFDGSDPGDGYYRAYTQDLMITSLKVWEYWIPNTLQEVIVTGGTTLAKGAFIRCSSIERVVLPETLTEILYCAFWGCTSLADINIPDAVATIGEDAFEKCSALVEISIGNNLTSLGASVFSGCASLVSITIPYVGKIAGKTSSDTYQYPFGYLFGSGIYSGGTGTLQYYYGEDTSETTSTRYYIPTTLRNVTITGGNILYGAFYNCSNITSITLGDGVTSIDENAFYNCTADLCFSTALISVMPKSVLKSVVFTDGATMPSFAFENCTNLTSITIADGVKSISYRAFYGCTSLASIIIPSSVTSIEGQAFYNCTALTSVYYTGDIDSWCRIMFGSLSAGDNPYLFSYADNLYINNELITDLIIPNTVTEIKDHTFYSYASLTSITIPNSVTSIGDYAFRNCTGLTSVTIPDSVTSIGSYAFYNCTSLESVTIGNGVTSIGMVAFQECTSLLNITIPNSVISIGFGAFNGCTSLTSVTIGDGVTSIGNGAFSGCPIETATIPAMAISHLLKDSLKSVTITKGSIGNSAFKNCTGLTSITIGDGVTNIEYNAFYGCTGITSVHISDIASWCGIEFGYSESNPLLYAHNLYINNELVTDLVIPDTVTEIKKYAFDGASCLTNVTIPDSVTSIGKYAFSGCTGLTRVYYTGDIASWCGITFDSNPLNYAHNLYINNELVTELVIPDGVTSIGHYAFCNCTSLTSVTIGNAITNMGAFAFSGCTSLASVTIPGSVTSMGQDVFSNCTSLTSVIIGDGVSSIGMQAFFGCTSLTNITIPESVTDIGDRAFGDGNNLQYNEYDNAYYLGNSTNPYVVLIKGKSTDITNCIVNENCKIIYYEAFFSVYRSLASVIIGDSVTTIGQRAFMDCPALTSIIIPDSVTSIGLDAFYNNPNLQYNEYDNAYYLGNSTNPYVVLIQAKSTDITSCTINENCKIICSSSFSPFYNCTSLESINIPNSVTSIGTYAFYNCTSLTSVIIGNGIMKISWNAFQKCTFLEKIYYVGTEEEKALIAVESPNANLTPVTWYYYSETEPVGAGNYWHYANDVVTEW